MYHLLSLFFLPTQFIYMCRRILKTNSTNWLVGVPETASRAMRTESWHVATKLLSKATRVLWVDVTEGTKRARILEGRYSSLQILPVSFSTGRINIGRQLHKRREMYVQRNNEEPSCNHCCSGKSNKYYIFWVCVCSLRYPACYAHAPYCHLWPDQLYNIFPHCLTNAIIFERNKSLNTERVFRFSLHLL
jgi:hypothetical protein